jgi:hypothetical protein
MRSPSIAWAAISATRTAINLCMQPVRGERDELGREHCHPEARVTRILRPIVTESPQHLGC